MATLFFLPLWTVYFQTFLNTSYCHKSRWHYWICLDSQSITAGITEGSVLQKANALLMRPVMNAHSVITPTPTEKAGARGVTWIQMPLNSRNQPEHLLTWMPGDCDVGNLYLMLLEALLPHIVWVPGYSYSLPMIYFSGLHHQVMAHARQRIKTWEGQQWVGQTTR